jgi:cyclopropane fatty-acyl-phospholipid synthase-like methyltransferase
VLPLSSRELTRRHHLTTQQLYNHAQDLLISHNMISKHSSKLKQTEVFKQIIRKSHNMASTTASKGSSTFYSTHSNNYDKMASNSTFSIAKLALTDPIFISFPITPSSYILNNACGTGIVTSLIKSQHPNVRILGTDLAHGMIETFKAKAARKGWENVETKIVDSRNLEGVENGCSATW